MLGASQLQALSEGLAARWTSTPSGQQWLLLNIQVEQTAAAMPGGLQPDQYLSCDRYCLGWGWTALPEPHGKALCPYKLLWVS